MYIKRVLESVIKEISHNFPVVMVSGPRQVGKTTMLRKIMEPDRKYISLDRPMQRQLAKSDPELFIQRYSPPVLIDEIQYAPELFPFLKIYADENEKNGSFWITGSQKFHLMKNVTESLAGRVGIINMLGLSNCELSHQINRPFSTDKQSIIIRLEKSKKIDLNGVYKKIFKGSMPALYKNNQNTEMFYSSYVETYIQRDVKQLSQVGDELSFIDFMSNCASRTGQMLNLTDIANQIGISTPTAKKWLSVLKTSGIITLIQPYSNNKLKRIVKTPKLFFLDTGLCAYLARYVSPETLEVSAISGAFLETYIVSEIIKSYYNAGRRPNLFYYRDSDKKEIDLIIEENDTLYPIEIKKSSNPSKKVIKNFKVLEKTGKNIGEGNVICLCDDFVPIDDKNYFVPVWTI